MPEVVIHRASAHDARVMAVLHASCFAKPWTDAAMMRDTMSAPPPGGLMRPSS